MDVKKNTSIGVVVSKSWANLQGVRVFLRDQPGDDIKGPDDSHLIFARVLDSSDDRGLWIELNTRHHKEDPSVQRLALMVPWHFVIAILILKGFVPAGDSEAIGFASGTLPPEDERV